MIPNYNNVHFRKMNQITKKKKIDPCISTTIVHTHTINAVNSRKGGGYRMVVSISMKKTQTPERMIDVVDGGVIDVGG